MTERGTERTFDQTQEPSPHEPIERPEHGRLPSSAEGKLRQLRGDLVLQLFMKQDPLWEAVRDVRERWNITPRVQLPTPVLGGLLPEDAPEPEDRRQDIEYPRRWKANEKHIEYKRQWREEMSNIRAKLDLGPSLPTQEYSDYQQNESWNEFLSACILYDPPEDKLIEFASYAKLESTALYDGLPYIRNKSSLEMMAPPIKSLWELTLLRDWYWHRILRSIGERYLEAWDVDVEDVLERATWSDSSWEIPGLYEEVVEKHEQYSKRYYIEVDEFTSLEDVKSAFRMIRSIQQPKRTKPPRDRLIAVQCAILYDQHNQPDLEDKRRRRWTYKKLAKEFELSSHRAAKYHVALGRKILSGEDPHEI
jgi:hypothetical protein